MPSRLFSDYNLPLPKFIYLSESDGNYYVAHFLQDDERPSTNCTLTGKHKQRRNPCSDDNKDSLHTHAVHITNAFHSASNDATKVKMLCCQTYSAHSQTHTHIGLQSIMINDLANQFDGCVSV